MDISLAAVLFVSTFIFVFGLWCLIQGAREAWNEWRARRRSGLAVIKKSLDKQAVSRRRRP